MALTISDNTMTSDRTPHSARRAPYMNSLWEVSWLPGQYLDRNEAITAMVLADTTANGDVHPGDRLWPHIWSWAAELRLTAHDAVTKTASPPRWADKDEIWEFLDDADRTDHGIEDGLNRYEPDWLPDPPSKANSRGVLQAGQDPQPEPDEPARPQPSPEPDKQADREAGWEAGQ